MAASTLALSILLHECTSPLWCVVLRMVKTWTEAQLLHQDSGFSHLVSQCSSRWNKSYQQINKKVQPSQTLFIPATFQTNTGTKPHPLCVHLEVSHTMRKLQLSATNLFLGDSSEGLKRKLLLTLKMRSPIPRFVLFTIMLAVQTSPASAPSHSNYIWGVFSSSN